MTGQPVKYVRRECGHCSRSSLTISGAWLRWRRELAGVSLRKLARLGGVSPAYLSDIERDNRRVTPGIKSVYQRHLAKRQV